MADNRAPPPPRGELIQTDGRRLHVVRAGPKDAGPVVLLEAGSFGFSADWAVVQDRLAVLGAPSIAYDRAGMALSDPGPPPRDSLAICGELEKLLAALGEAGPFVIVGHSMAGLHIHHFAARNPRLVAGLVFVDAITPELAADPWVRRGAAQYVRLAKAAAAAASLGLLRLASPWGDRIGLPPDPARQKRWAFGDPGHNRTAADEVVQWEASAAQAASAGPLNPAWPTAVVLAGPERGTPAQRRLRTAPADRASNGYVERAAAARHASLIGERYAGAVA
jgi:pimeloyl-ACP methyl ester carboxylesterase